MQLSSLIPIFDHFMIKVKSGDSSIFVIKEGREREREESEKRYRYAFCWMTFVARHSKKSIVWPEATMCVANLLWSLYIKQACVKILPLRKLDKDVTDFRAVVKCCVREFFGLSGRVTPFEVGPFSVSPSFPLSWSRIDVILEGFLLLRHYTILSQRTQWFLNYIQKSSNVCQGFYIKRISWCMIKNSHFKWEI